ncbi:MAG: rhamnan synthesis F family protein, partial [Rickettsiales bacterium]|nr:rhamnan synthesis F family protein [Rickettsiales bacterium]
FIFAGYSPDGAIDETDIFYIRALTRLGDVIFIADSDIPKSELRKIKNVIHAEAKRHGEYDFGSYKRGYQYAKKAGLLEKYDWVYFANNSVYGPVKPLGPVLKELESRGAPAVGMIGLGGKGAVNAQSWFFGMDRRIFQSDWFARFIGGVEKQKDKMDVVHIYEFGMSRIVALQGFGIEVYEKELYGTSARAKSATLLKRGMPFVKKTGIPYMTRRQLFENVKGDIARMIDGHAKRAGIKYENFFRTNKRKLKYEKSLEKYGPLSLCTIFHWCLYKPLTIPAIPLLFAWDFLRSIFKGAIKF